MRNQIIAALLLATAASGIAVAQTAANGHAGHAAAPGKPSLGEFGVDLTGMDTSVQPGEDFYAFVNGKWQQRTEIPSDRSSWGGFGELRDLSDQRTRSLI